MRCRTPRWSMRAGCRGRGWWSRRTATSTPSTRRWPRAHEERAVVITESVFSTDGALAPLRELHEACRRHRALLIVDEAHGLGVRGDGGAGCCTSWAGRCARRGDDHDAVQGARQPGRRGAGVGGGARSSDRRGAPVHLRHRPGAGGGRRRAGRAAGAAAPSRGGPTRYCATPPCWPRSAACPMRRSRRWCR